MAFRDSQLSCGEDGVSVADHIMIEPVQWKTSRPVTPPTAWLCLFKAPFEDAMSEYEQKNIGGHMAWVKKIDNFYLSKII